jgi:Zn-finger nucleic acid-binding protein
MREMKDERATVDFCVGCGGLWLDRGELESQGAWLPKKMPAVPTPTPRSCPRCVAPMGAFQRDDVTIDRCKACRGIYLDRGELERLVEMTKNDDARVASEALERDAKNVGVGGLGVLLDVVLAFFVLALCGCASSTPAAATPPPEATAPAPSASPAATTTATAEAPAPAPQRPLDLTSACPHDVHLYFGDHPGDGKGEAVTLATGATIPVPRKADGTQVVWVVDERGSGLASVNITKHMRHVRIDAACMKIDADSTR